MGIITSGIPKETVLFLKGSFKIPFFIETGTYKGKTAIWAADHFKTVYTIEYSKSIFKEAKKLLGGIENIRCTYGDTKKELKEIIKELAGPALFWLDAHWSGSNTYGKSDECPLLEELAIINASPENHFILIDDARLFLAPPPPPHNPTHWPTISQIIKALNNKNRFILVFDDVIYALPQKAKSAFIEYYREGYLRKGWSFNTFLYRLSQILNT